MSNAFHHLSRGNRYRLRLLKLKILGAGTTLTIFATIGAILLTVFFFIWFSRDLPTPDRVQRHTGFSTLILDRNSKPVYDIYEDKNRIPVILTDIPDFLKKATIAIEDKDFYKHQGFDPKGILRSIFSIATLRGVQGGSTLTQQLVKNVLLTSERTLPRKIKEFILAVQIERKYSKDEILQMYLNEAPYGGTNWGIESAAQNYFAKSTKDLSFLEAAVLAGFPQRPSYYSPYGPNSKAYISRTEEVLRRMREDGYISGLEEVEAKRELPGLKFATESSSLAAPHFVLYVKKQLIEKFGEKALEEGGLKVTTTLDLDLQKKAEIIVREEVEKLKGLSVSNAASLAINPQTGEILTYVGSKEYDSADTDFQGKFDVVSMGYRQPGSALKPITYAAAFAKGYTPSSLLLDVETHFPGGKEKEDYTPKNYDNKFRGPVLLRKALANSINIPAVKLTALVGIRDILKLATDMGITSLAPTNENVNKFGLAITLGGGEVRLLDLVQSYGVLATNGMKNDLYAITRVVDSRGKVLYEHKNVSGKRVLSPELSFLINDILSDNESRKEIFGERSYLVIPGKTVAAKTGTTDDKRDNWTIGFTPSVVTGVWVGNNDNSPMNPKLASGVTGAAPIWNRLMKEALNKKSDEPFGKPSGIVTLTIDAYAGGLPQAGRPTRSEFFLKGTEPGLTSSVYKKIKLSKSDNKKLANNVEIATGQYEEKDFIVFTEDDPTSKDGKNRWQEGIDAWLETQSDPLFHPPKESSTTDENKVVVRIKKPLDKEEIDSNSLEIQADAKALKEIKKIELFIDDSLKTTVNSSNLSETVNLETGIHKIKVKGYDEEGRSGESEITVGIKVAAEATGTPVPSPTTAIASPSPTP